MTTGLNTIIYPVKDLDAAKRLYSKLLGDEPYMDQPYYIGFKVGGQELGLDPNGHGKGMTGPLGYWHVEDINSTVAALVAEGGEVTDVGGGRLIATVIDSDGNPVGVLQA